jgi:hypothetical protein
MTLSGMYNRLCLPGEKPRTYLHAFNTVGSMRFEPDPALAWHDRLQGNIYQHPVPPDYSIVLISLTISGNE